AAQATIAGHAALGESALTDAVVQVTTSADHVMVSISGQAPGILRGTSRAVRVSVELPLEGWVPL
ncbi:MAG: hypothetical protein JWM12_1888, partial [Ilumatobacteraceae bacterium]|nr:hypothetical protein [Ilumatobacteraceae bacterium]